jgi:hypothetical protein
VSSDPASVQLVYIISASKAPGISSVGVVYSFAIKMSSYEA